MGRNLKSGMDYFDHSTTAHADIKLEKVMAWYGAKGYAVYFYLLEKIYAEPDYCLNIEDEDTLVLIANRLRLEVTELRDIITKCVMVDLFDRNTYETDRILTSHGIQKRANEVELKREKERMKKFSPDSESIFPRENEINPRENGINPRENGSFPQGKDTYKNRTEERKTEEIKTEKNISARHCFVKPTIEEIAAYCAERNNGIDAEAFFAFYESVGWKVGSKPMKDWKSAVITWEKRNHRQAPVKTQSTNPFLDLAMRGRASK